MSTMTEMQKIIGAFVIGVVVGAAGFWAINSSGMTDSTIKESNEEAEEMDEEENTEEMTFDEESDTGAVEEQISDSSNDSSASVLAGSGDEVAVDDQIAGNQVRVKLARFSAPGWVVVHEDRGGVPGNVLGAAWYPEGIHLATVDLLRSTVSGGTYYVMLHSDNGDKQFDLKADGALMDGGGKVLMASFKAN